MAALTTNADNGPVIAKKRSRDEIVAEILGAQPTPEQEAAADRARELVARYIPLGTRLSDELIADRRREASGE
jgi:hypothetical protein